jgi:hypothetical protein
MTSLPAPSGLAVGANRALAIVLDFGVSITGVRVGLSRQFFALGCHLFHVAAWRQTPNPPSMTVAGLL